MQGKLIVIDGIDGSGKTLQIQKLEEALLAMDLRVLSLKFPRHESLSGQLFDMGKKGLLGSTTRESFAIISALNFAEQVQTICDGLLKGSVVILQRYTLASAAHGAMDIDSKEDRVAFYRWLDKLHYSWFALPKPDLQIILDVGESVAHKLIRSLHKPTETQSVTYLEKCRKRYIELASLMPNTRLVECSKSGEILDAEIIHNQIWELARRLVLQTRIGGN